MKRVQEDDASANKRKKKGDYVDDNDEEEDLLVVCFSHIEGVDDGHSQNLLGSTESASSLQWGSGAVLGSPAASPPPPP